MPQGLQAVLALLILLPGFVSSRIVRMMSARSQQSELEKIIEALIFSFFIYVVYIAAFGSALPLEWTIPVSPLKAGDLTHFGLIVHRWRVLALSLFAIVCGVAAGFVRGHDLDLKLLGKFTFLERVTREPIWNKVFLGLEGTVQVGLADGRSAIGWLKFYPYSDEERCLFLENASWVGADGSLVPIEGAGLLLTEKSEIHFVMFLDPHSAGALDAEASTEEDLGKID